MIRFCTVLAAFFIVQGATAVNAGQVPGKNEKYQGWISEMKSSERGPFSRVRWFCADGTVLPPTAYACRPHGGGHQHGEWSEHTRQLRGNGYLVANLLAGIQPDRLLADAGVRDQLAFLLIERFLVAADDGWIFRRALYYRGAIQEEDERAGSRALLVEMAGRDEWIGPGFVALRTAVRMLPHGVDHASFHKVRQLSASLSVQDNGFKPLRAKIHGAPGAEDAQRVREYAAGLEAQERKPYLELADQIDAVYRSAPLDEELKRLANTYTAAPWLQELLNQAAAKLGPQASPPGRFAATARLLADLRHSLSRVRSSAVRLELLDLGLRLENEHFRAGSDLRSTLVQISRSQRLELLESAGLAAFGTGLVNARLLAQLTGSIRRISKAEVRLDRYLDELGYLGRAPGWGTQALRMHFHVSMEKLGEIEPMAMLFIQDQLRGSPLVFFSQVLDGLARDANQLAGVKHRLFGERIGVGFSALSPGLATGILHVEPDLSKLEQFRSDGIYVLPETVSDLPPVAGILTRGEGNPLSHVQLLARNLGIPNVRVDSDLQQTLAEHDGQRVVLAVSKSGLVELSAWNERWSEILDDVGAGQGASITPNLEKLDLAVRRFVSLDELRASDSGRIVGPKAASLGELRKHYPGHVPRGVAIPFGLFFQEVMEQTHPAGGTVFDWMLGEYRKLQAIPSDHPDHAKKAEALRAELYGMIANTRPSASFQQELKEALKTAFGSDSPPGLFVRSDTNVEDLAGFTGAGLNLTLPNVVGFDPLLRSIARVWASPLSARAFAWRQSYMTRPEHVYTSILLLESVASEKSGVLVTQDIYTGNRDVLSVVANEGLGGAVDGQAAESLRIPLDGSPVRVLATATAPWRRVLDPAGGLQFLPGSGSETVLLPDEIAQLIEFSRGLPQNFTPITDEEGESAPADLEFGFVKGDLRLFQLRPFLESKKARGIGYLHGMEGRLADASDVAVDMNGVPE